MGTNAGPIAVIVTAVLAGNTDAVTDQSIHAIGCTILGELTRRHTLHKLTDYAGQSDDRHGRQTGDYTLPRACDHTAAAVSRGFASALAQLDIPVRWSSFGAETGCVSTDIARCHPFVDRSSVPPALQSSGVIDEVWRDVRYVISTHMPWGSHSDLSYFTAEALQSACDSAGRPTAGSISIEPAPRRVW